MEEISLIRTFKLIKRAPEGRENIFFKSNERAVVDISNLITMTAISNGPVEFIMIA